MQGSSKRENLEQTLRRRLVAEIRRLQDFNRDLRGMDYCHKTHNTISECSTIISDPEVTYFTM